MLKRILDEDLLVEFKTLYLNRGDTSSNDRISVIMRKIHQNKDVMLNHIPRHAQNESDMIKFLTKELYNRLRAEDANGGIENPRMRKLSTDLNMYHLYIYEIICVLREIMNDLILGKLEETKIEKFASLKKSIDAPIDYYNKNYESYKTIETSYYERISSMFAEVYIAAKYIHTLCACISGIMDCGIVLELYNTSRALDRLIPSDMEGHIVTRASMLKNELGLSEEIFKGIENDK